MNLIPKAVDLGKPDKNPGVILEPIEHPLERPAPKETPVEPVRSPSREPVPV